MVDVGISYDVNGVVQVQAVQRDTGHSLALAVEPVPDDLSWMGRPPEVAVAGEAERIRVFLLMDVSSSMIGLPLVEAQTAARGVPRPLRLHHDGGGPDLVFQPGRAPMRGDEQCQAAARRDRPARGRGVART